MRFLFFGLDKFVHGAYITSLELYDPYNRQFMTNGHGATQIRQMYMRWVASKLHEVLSRLVYIAGAANMAEVLEDIKLAALQLYESEELLHG